MPLAPLNRCHRLLLGNLGDDTEGPELADISRSQQTKLPDNPTFDKGYAAAYG